MLLAGADHVTVIDLGSKNGTFLNGERIHRANAKVGDILAFGPVRSSLEWGEEEDLRLALRIDQDGSDLSEATRSATCAVDAEEGVAVDDRLRFPEAWLATVSPAMDLLLRELRPIACRNFPILLIGETGVGKELLANALHLSSPRAEGPFVAINCAAIPENLLEAELFGIGDRVATDVAGRQGKFQDADGGTLFLDEVGEMASSYQIRLLRVLQERQIEPIGRAPVAIDVRIVAATNADIYKQMDEGRFRSDLFYRLAGHVARIPPLRHRREDLPLLIEGFMRRFAKASGRRISGLTARALDHLVAYPWPGNVRQLQHEIQRVVYSCPATGVMDVDHLSSEIRAVRSGATTNDTDLDDPSQSPAPNLPTLNLLTLEGFAIKEALRRCPQRGDAAELLGITRHALRRRLQRQGLDEVDD